MNRTYCRLLCVWVIFVTSYRVNPASGSEDSQTRDDRLKTTRLIYKQQPRRTLTVYFPDDWKASDKRSALVIFRCRIPEQREHFRKLGMVIIKPQLAAVNSGKLRGMTLAEIAKAPKPRNQVEDTKSVIRYLRINAGKLGIAADRIVATGTSGGGDLALQSYINAAFEDPQDDKAVSHRPNALVLYCPAFDGIDIWHVKTKSLIEKTKAEAPSYLPLLTKFIKNTTDEYAQPLNHRADLIKLAATLGKEKGIDDSEIKSFQETLQMFNERDWQLLQPAEEALQMSASRILSKEPLPPTLVMFGDRDHLYEYQSKFVARAKSLGQKFQLKIYKHGGHSFMLQPAFLESSTQEVESFLRKNHFLQ